MNLIYKIAFTATLSFNLSTFISGLMFEKGLTSYNISNIGLGLVLLPVSYRALANVFATKIVILDKDELEKQLERKLKEKMEQE